jgi:hypothetical protein
MDGHTPRGWDRIEASVGSRAEPPGSSFERLHGCLDWALGLQWCHRARPDATTAILVAQIGLRWWNWYVRRHAYPASRMA